MLSLERENIVWAWVCPVTGMVLDEKWASTEPYATRQTKAYWRGRFQYGEMKAMRVKLEPLTDEETAELRAKFAEWLARKEEPGCARMPAAEASGPR